MRPCLRLFVLLFQSTLPREERPAALPVFPAILYFNPRSPREERQAFGVMQEIIQTFQSTLHRGATLLLGADVPDAFISIHAPTRGATPYALVLAIIEYISIHAPTRGATYHNAAGFRQQEISIHAPTRGATQCDP